MSDRQGENEMPERMITTIQIAFDADPDKAEKYIKDTLEHVRHLIRGWDYLEVGGQKLSPTKFPKLKSRGVPV